MSYGSWIRGERAQAAKLAQLQTEQAIRRYFGFKESELPDGPWPTYFERFCVEHDEKLNWLLCPKGHQLTGAEDWIVKDVRTGEVIAKCRENDGTQSWRGPAPR